MQLRDRPFNLQGVGVEAGYGFFSREARNFFPEFNIRLYDKNSESDKNKFPPPKSEYFFRKKT
jgi:hypothetical protein